MQPHSHPSFALPPLPPPWHFYLKGLGHRSAQRLKNVHPLWTYAKNNGMQILTPPSPKNSQVPHKTKGLGEGCLQQSPLFGLKPEMAHVP